MLSTRLEDLGRLSRIQPPPRRRCHRGGRDFKRVKLSLNDDRLIKSTGNPLKLRVSGSCPRRTARSTYQADVRPFAARYPRFHLVAKLAVLLVRLSQLRLVRHPNGNHLTFVCSTARLQFVKLALRRFFDVIHLLFRQTTAAQCYGCSTKRLFSSLLCCGCVSA